MQTLVDTGIAQTIATKILSGVQAALDQAAVERRAEEGHYGTIWKSTEEWFKSQINQAKTEQQLGTVLAARTVFALALCNSSGLVARLDFAQIDDFKNELSALQERAKQGDISTLISEQYRMPANVAEQQVRYMDSLLSQLGEHATAVQVVLANMNYSFFKPNASMTTGEITLRQFEQLFEKLGSLTDEGNRAQGMPHLVRSNAIMAAIVDALVARSSDDKRINSVIAPGAGYGATPGAAFALLLKTCGAMVAPPMPNVLSIEPSPDFFSGLQETTRVAQDMLTNTGAINPGRIENFHGDIISVLKQHAESFAQGGEYNPDLSRLGQQPAVFLFNYVLHRLGSAQKQELFKLIAEKFEEPLILIGDLAKNGSVINRGYFNYAYNGPLNAGNIDLRSDLESSGYQVMTLAEFATRHPTLTDKISAISQMSGTSDELFYVAFKLQSPKLQALMQAA
jgi:hypothetical protein